MNLSTTSGTTGSATSSINVLSTDVSTTSGTTESASSSGKIWGVRYRNRRKGIDKCEHCVQKIHETAPIFMRHDRAYCSVACRDSDTRVLLCGLSGIGRTQEQVLRALGSFSMSTALHSSLSQLLGSAKNLVGSTHKESKEQVQVQGRGRLTTIFGAVANAGLNIVEKIACRVASSSLLSPEGRMASSSSLLHAVVSDLRDRGSFQHSRSELTDRVVSSESASCSCPSISGHSDSGTESSL